MWLSRLGAAVPDPHGPSLPWGTACLLLREAFERLATGPQLTSDSAQRGTRSAFTAPGNFTRTPPKIQTGGGGGGGKMRHSWRGRQQPSSWAPLQSCRGDHTPPHLSRKPLSGGARSHQPGPFFWGGGMAGEGCNPRYPTWRAPGAGSHAEATRGRMI